MKKLFPLFLILTLSIVFAVDMSGKFGMGVGWTVGSEGFGPHYATTKFGLGEKLVLEPTLHFSYTSYSSEGVDDYEYNLDLAVLFAYALMAQEKTNLYGKAGIGFGLSVPTMDGGISTTFFGIPLRLGFEHFMSEHFAVDLNAKMGLNFNKTGDTETTNFTLSNQAITAGFVWYY